MKVIKYLLIIILLMSMFLGLNSKKYDYFPERYSDEEQIKYVINHYFMLRYEGQKNLQFNDFSYLIADWIDETNEWTKTEIEKREIEQYLAKLYDLSYEMYDYKLDYKDFHYMLNNKKVVVTLLENHDVTFKAISPQVSSLANREHFISLRKKKGIWKISFNQYNSEFSQLLKDYSKNEIINRIDKNKKTELINIKKWRKSKNKISEKKSEEIQKYNRKKAVIYANQYWKNYNRIFYDFPKNDCTNYVSQILLAGGAPTDKSGQYQWFLDNMDNPGVSYSYSWAVVQDLYYYLVKNYWTGPCGKKSTLCEMEAGDIIQFYSISKGWLHSIIVVKAPKITNCGESLHYLINSHDSDRKNYPLAYFGAHRKRFIHVEGWYK